MFLKSFLFTILLLGCGLVEVTRAQRDFRVVDRERGFSIIRPPHSEASGRPGSVLDFTGDKKIYGENARYVITSVHPFSTNVEDAEGNMKKELMLKAFEDHITEALKSVFPDLHSTGRGFIYLNQRPAVHGTFTFTASNRPMKGRYMILMVKELSSFYSFTWSSEERYFAEWNRLAEISTASLKILPQPRPGPREAER